MERKGFGRGENLSLVRWESSRASQSVPGFVSRDLQHLQEHHHNNRKLHPRALEQHPSHFTLFHIPFPDRR